MVFFIAFWTILIQIPFGKLIFDIEVPNHSWQSELAGILRRLIWISPTFWLIKHYKNDLKINLKKMFLNKVNFKLFFIFFTIFSIYVLGAMFFIHGKFHINTSQNLFSTMLFYLTVGFVEEMGYRAWGLNAFSKFMSERKANITQVVFFLILHYPAYIRHWITKGTLNFSGTNNLFEPSGFLFHSMIIIVLGLIFGYIFRKNKSIIPGIILHSYYDFLVTLLI